MIEQCVLRFCETRYRWLIVIAGTFSLGLVLVIPLVDAYSAGRDEKDDLLIELDSARNTVAGLEQFESRVAEKLVQLQAAEEKTVTEETLPVFRSTLVDDAKETGCSIRRITVGAASSRAWNGEQSPIESVAGDSDQSESGFVLEWRPISLSLTGTSGNLKAMVQRVADAGMLMHTKSFEMYPANSTRQTLTLDVEFWYFTLVRK